MAKYVDGFVIPLKKRNVNAYRRMAAWGCRTWLKHGALDYYECVADDLRVQPGCGQGFRRLARLKADETVVFAFIVYKSKAHRDRINKKVMADAGMNEWSGKPIPFDMKRFAFGGFRALVTK
jgi:uncharacterized protein YbaA (DUF1428 family)